MGILNRIYNQLRDRYWEVISKRKKRLFNEGKIQIYQYMDEMFFWNKEVYDKESTSLRPKGLWEGKEEYSLKDYYPQTYEKAYDLVVNHYLRRYDIPPCLMDIGCATGEWTLIMAPSCRSIDGYEYSQSFVETAIRKASHIENVNFYQADAITMQLDKVYDGASALGVLMYFSNVEDVSCILTNIYRSLREGAYLCTRDTVHNENMDVLYLFNKKNGYKAAYMRKDLYYELFKKAGFVMVEELILGENYWRRIHSTHIGNIWLKP